MTNAVRTRLAYTPQLWVYAVAAVAMSVLVARHLLPSVEAGHHHHGMDSAAPAPAQKVISTWWWWTVMSVAMMFPVVAPAARRVARAGLWRRRHVAMAEFLGGYLVVWALVGLLAVFIVSVVWPHGAPPYSVAVALAVAAVWQVAPIRRQVLRRCRGSAFVNVHGWRADRDCATAGFAEGRRCVVTCGPVMVVMAVGHSLALMAFVSVLLLTERARGPNPDQRAGRAFEAVCLAALAVFVLGWQFAASS